MTLLRGTEALHARVAELEQAVSPVLTKRELFAAMAMQGMMSTEMALKSTRTPRDLMRGCAEVADALIAELAKAQP
jgi:hypothetical protein